MTTIEPMKAACPSCGQEFKSYVTTSTNTFGATFYTDGGISSSMYQEDDLVLICPFCKEYIWTNGLKWESAYDSDDEFAMLIRDVDTPVETKESKIPSAISLGFAGGPSYLKALEDKPWKNIEQEVRFRHAAWIDSNDPYREEVADESLKELVLERRKQRRIEEEAPRENNMRALLKSLNQLVAQADNSEEVLDIFTISAELHRELGEFEECLTMLGNADNLLDAIELEETSSIASYLSVIRDLANEKKADLVKLE
jgi:hypothetical protein